MLVEEPIYSRPGDHRHVTPRTRKAASVFRAALDLRLRNRLLVEGSYGIMTRLVRRIDHAPGPALDALGFFGRGSERHDQCLHDHEIVVKRTREVTLLVARARCSLTALAADPSACSEGLEPPSFQIITLGCSTTELRTLGAFGWG